jgi:putative membrane protein
MIEQNHQDDSRKKTESNLKEEPTSDVIAEEISKTRKGKSFIKYLFTFGQGFIMGISNIIPGVSGGTIALVMGIYTRFIKALSDVSRWFTSVLTFLTRFKDKYKQRVKDRFQSVEWVWVVVLFVGRGIAVLLASSLMKYLIENYPSQTYGAFFGLILASVVVPGSKMERIKLPEILATIAGFALLYWFSGLEIFYTNPNPAFWLLILGGFVATSAMILPGISGSFLLLMLGVHTFIFGLATKILHGQLFTAGVIIPLVLYAIGWVGGLLTFSRFLNWLLKRYHSVTMGFLIGLMLGSLRKIYPFINIYAREPEMKIDEIPKLIFWEMPEGLSISEYLSSWEFISIMICMFSGVVLVLFLHFISIKLKSEKQTQTNNSKI